MRDSKQSSASSTVLALGVLWVLPLPASAVDTNLAEFPGLNPDVQRPVARVVQAACVGLRTKRNAGVTPTVPAANVLPPAQEKLFQACARMVQSANQLTPGNTEATGLSMGLTAQQLGSALGGIAPEEVSSQGRTAVEAAGSNAIGVRLFALRNGTRGFGVAAAGHYGTTEQTAALLSPTDSGGGAAADSPGRLGGFLNVNDNRGSRATTSREDGFDFDSRGATLGVDYRFSDSLVGGLALTYGSTDADIVAGLGTANSTSRAVSLYGSWYMQNAYVDLQLGYSRNNYDTMRRILVPSNSGVSGLDTSAVGSTTGNQFSAVVGTGYDIRSGSLLVTPYARFELLNLRIDGYTESEPTHSLGLDVGSQSLRSVQTALGVKLAYNLSTESGVVVPYASVEWNHEFANDTRSLTAKYANDPNNNFFAIPTDEPDRNYFTLSAGVSMLWRNGISGFVNLSLVEGLAHVKNRGIAAGVRIEF